MLSNASGVQLPIARERSDKSCAQNKKSFVANSAKCGLAPNVSHFGKWETLASNALSPRQEAVRQGNW
jgi:hypothetical protein